MQPATDPALAPELSISSIVKQVKGLQTELNELFPEREALITQMIYALLTREHVLVFGQYGTGKSRLVDQFFGAFTGANNFSIELNKFMNESNIVGIPNPKIMREEGRIWHERKGTMLDAHFAELDEFFDANGLLLRVLLGILNERRFNRGIQIEKANLHMALASTNASPEVEVKENPSLGAVVDRFLFQTEVGYLQNDDSRRRMYSKYLANERPSITINYTDLVRLVDEVLLVPFNESSLLELHNQIIQSFQNKIAQKFSDRRACQALKIVQANAVLEGRIEPSPEDFGSIMWVLCYGDRKEMQDEFKRVANPLIEKAINELKPDIVKTQMRLIDELEKRVPTLDADPRTTTPDQLVLLRRTLIALKSDVEGLKPSHPTVEDRQKKLLQTVDKTNATVGRLIDGEVRV